MYVHHTNFCVLIRRSQIEAMVPFAFPNPTPASERRRVRNASGLLFSVVGGRATDVLSDRTAGGGGRGSGSGSGSGNGSSNGSIPGPVAPVPTAATVRRAASIGGGGGAGPGSSHPSGGGGGGGGRRAAGGQSHSPNLEQQLYAGLGSLLEVKKASPAHKTNRCLFAVLIYPLWALLGCSWRVGR